VVGYGIDVSAEEQKNPKWSFTIHRYDGRWKQKDKEWGNGKWTKEGTIEIGFIEPFQALVKEEDYFFVTESRRLFVARKPTKGSERKLTAVWNEPDRPITAILTDADADRTFLFVAAKEKGGKPAFFELSDKPKLEEYDPASVPLPRLEEPHRTLLHLARILAAQKKIKSK
jgi:hypothetical protein